MNLAEVVEHKIEADRVHVVLDLLTEPVGQPREAPHVHAHREVRALNVGR